MRHLSTTDRLLVTASNALETLFAKPNARRPYPAAQTEDDQLTDEEKERSARYMRVNHVGEICAQALYQSAALTARSQETIDQMREASNEEEDHLAWCEQRISDLGGRKSLLNPLWYAGSFAIGSAAGLAGDKWSLGFVAETEHQVVSHLQDHLGKLPENDLASKQVVTQMQIDEQMHKDAAIAQGASDLPKPVKSMMAIAAKIMTRTAHWI